MQSTRLLVIAAGILAVGAAVAAYRTAVRLTPERLRAEVESRVAAWIDAPVDVGAVRPTFRAGLGLEVRGLSSGAGPDAPGIQVARARVLLDLRSALFGSLEPRWIELTGVRARVARTEEGGWQPEAIARLATAARSDGGAPVGLRARLAEAARLALRAPPPVPRVEVHDAELRFLDAQERNRGGEPLRFEDLRLRFGRRLLGRSLGLHATASLAGPQGVGGRLEAEAGIRHPGSFELSVAAQQLDLGLMAPYLRELAPGASVGGQASGSLHWRAAGPDAHRFELDVSGDELVLRPGGRSGRSPLVASHLETHLEAEIHAAELRVSEFRGVLGGAELLGEGRVELPLEASSRTQVALRASEIPLAGVRDVLLALLPAEARALRRMATGLREGRVTRLSAGCTRASLDAWRRLPGSPLDAWPRDLTLGIELSEVGLELPGGHPLEDLSGRLSWSSERLEIREAQARFGGKPLPRLDVTLAGPRHLAAARPVDPLDAPGPRDLPGRVPLWSWIEAQRRPDAQTPSWSRLGIDADWVDHPALLWPLESVRARLAPGEDAVTFALDETRWGGVPLRGTGSLSGEAPGRLTLDLEAGPRNGDGAAPRTGEGWARGRLEAEVARLGRFPAQRVTGTFRVVGEELELGDLELELDPRGLVQGSVVLDLSRADAVPFTAGLQLVDASLAYVASVLGVDPSGNSGEVVGGLHTRGLLRPGRPLLADLEGPLSMHARGGELRRRLPALVAIAAAVDRLNPFLARESVPYRAIDAELEFREGRLRAVSMALEGPALRMAATGSVDLTRAPHDLEAVVGLFFFPNLDSILGKVPLLNRLLLGSDDNLVAGYFAVNGPWDAPEARLIPTRSLAAGPASAVLVGLPGFAREGVVQVQKLFGALLPRDASDATDGGADLPEADAPASAAPR